MGRRSHDRPPKAEARAGRFSGRELYLSGRTAWVTGGASGMGRATALRLAKAGANVAIGSLVKSQRGVALKDQNVHTPADEALPRRRPRSKRWGQRFGDAARCLLRQLRAGVLRRHRRAFGKIDILINAAGSSARKPMLDHPDALWHRMIETNLSGPYRTIKRCFPGMIERRCGRIVNFASTAANVG